jgi:hypothetical protein
VTRIGKFRYVVAPQDSDEPIDAASPVPENLPQLFVRLNKLLSSVVVTCIEPEHGAHQQGNGAGSYDDRRGALGLSLAEHLGCVRPAFGRTAAHI